MLLPVEKITWYSIEFAAQQVFDLWVGHLAELKWAKEAWEILTAAGLTTYSNEIERSEKLIYFLSLAGIYRDFWCLAVDECVEIEYKQVADNLRIGIEAFNKEQLCEYIQLVQEDQYEGIEIKLLNKQQLLDYIQLIHEDADLEDTTYNFYNSHFKQLANENRRTVYSALVQGFGNNTDFFISLWRSGQNNSDRNHFNYNYQDDEDIEDLDDTDQDILNTPTPEKERAFIWIEEGCTRYL